MARYLEDYVEGSSQDAGSVTISEADIQEFARRYDPQPFHIDPVAAAQTPYGGIIASVTGSRSSAFAPPFWV